MCRAWKGSPAKGRSAGGKLPLHVRFRYRWSMKFQLKGLSAVVAIVAVVGIAAFGTTTARADLDRGATEELTRVIGSGYARTKMRAIAAADPEKPALEEIEALFTLQNIEFTSIDARGRPSDMTVRVEISVNDGPPPDGRDVRYFEMSHDAVVGWRVEREIPARSYYLKLF